MFRRGLTFSAILCLLLAMLPTGAGAADTHVVAKGETLYGIARVNGTTVAALKQANQIDGDLIRIGQKLVIPGKAPATKSAPQPVPAVIAAPEPAPAPPRAEVVEDVEIEPGWVGMKGDDAWRLQVFLDRAQFPPGKVDGAPGLFTGKAVAAWLRANPGQSEAALMLRVREEIPAPVIRARVPDLPDQIGPLPATLEEKAEAERLPYESLLELMAERYHTDEQALARLNPGVNLAALKPGQEIRAPNVEPFLIESWSKAPGLAKENVPGARVRVLHHENHLEVTDGTGRLIAAFPITVGRKPEHVRQGDWRVASCGPNPPFLWDEELLKNGVSGKVKYQLPAGPNNPVGVLWLGLQPVEGAWAHIGFHGTDTPRHIGRNASSGCIRLANWDIVRLARIIGVGTPVNWGGAAPALISGR
jgi:LysM repeat protein